MNKKIWIGFGMLAMLVLAAAGCSKTEGADSAGSAVATSSEPVVTTRQAPDNSQITTSIDATGVKTETRVFNDNPRVEKVVVTTHDGQRTAKVYSRNGEERELKSEDSKNLLEAAGDAIADAAGFAVEKAGDVASKTKEGAATVGEKTADTATRVGKKTADVGKTVGEKTVEGAKRVGSKTAAGAKKTGSAIKKVVKP